MCQIASMSVMGVGGTRRTVVLVLMDATPAQAVKARRQALRLQHQRSRAETEH